MKLQEQVKIRTHRIRMRLLNTNPHPEATGETQTPYVENYYNISSKPEGVLGVPSFERITIKDIYPGIDWVIYFSEQGLKYDFWVHPGADPNRIQMKYLHADGINDEFEVVVLCPLETYRLRVFSRWGDLLFDSQQTGEGWDGMARNKLLPQGVYVRMLVYEQDGEFFEKRGEINLLQN